MLGTGLLQLTFYISIVVQIITGLVTFGGIFYKLPKQDKVLKDILALETIVQVIEGIFYVYIIMSFRYIRNYVITRRRYLDWVITTPMMLLSTIIYMEYENKKLEGKTVDTKNFIRNNRKNITNMFLFNMLMLVSGFLGEGNFSSRLKLHSVRPPGPVSLARNNTARGRDNNKL